MNWTETFFIRSCSWGHNTIIIVSHLNTLFQRKILQKILNEFVDSFQKLKLTQSSLNTDEIRKAYRIVS